MLLEKKAFFKSYLLITITVYKIYFFLATRQMFKNITAGLLLILKSSVLILQ